MPTPRELHPQHRASRSPRSPRSNLWTMDTPPAQAGSARGKGSAAQGKGRKGTPAAELAATAAVVSALPRGLPRAA
jgi:hypothetical protein